MPMSRDGRECLAEAIRDLYAAPGEGPTLETLMSVIESYEIAFNPPAPRPSLSSSRPQIEGRSGLPESWAQTPQGIEIRASEMVLIRTLAGSVRPAQIVEKGGTGEPAGSRPLWWRVPPYIGDPPRFFELNEVNAWSRLPRISDPAPATSPSRSRWNDISSYAAEYSRRAQRVREGDQTAYFYTADFGRAEQNLAAASAWTPPPPQPEPSPSDPAGVGTYTTPAPSPIDFMDVRIGQYADYYPPPQTERSSEPRTAAGFAVHPFTMRDIFTDGDITDILVSDSVGADNAAQSAPQS